MPTPRPCLSCPAITRHGPRCPACAAVYQRQVDRRRGSSTQRGYGSDWRRAREVVLKAQPWCSDCLTEGSPSNPLSVDHRVPKLRGGTDDPSNLEVRCRRCNSAKGSR